VPERPFFDVEAFQQEAEQTAEKLSSLMEGQGLEGQGLEDSSTDVVVARAAYLALTASAAALGECRREMPYAPLYPLIDSDGEFKWCCTHSPRHCTS
jgi:hypothetical protein